MRRLNIRDCERCILGLLFGGFMSNEARPILAAARRRYKDLSFAKHGFDASWTDTDEDKRKVEAEWRRRIPPKRKPIVKKTVKSKGLVSAKGKSVKKV